MGLTAQQKAILSRAAQPKAPRKKGSQSDVALHPGRHKFEELIKGFIADQDIAPSSRRTYRSAMEQFVTWYLSWHSLHPADNPTRETILQYKEWLDQKGLQPFTRANYLVAVRRFFEWAEGKKLHPNIAKGIKGSRRVIKAHQKSALTIEQVQYLLGSIDQSTLNGKRDFALVNLLCRTGLRLIEVKRAVIGDMEQQANGTALLWIRGKGRDGKDDFVLLTAEALEPIACYLAARGSPRLDQPLFASVSDRNQGRQLTTFSLSRLIKCRLRAAGLGNKRVTAHSLRHTFGVLAITAGASLYEVQLAMRHTSPSTTEMYLGDIERQKRLEGGPEKLITKLFKK